MGHQKLVKYGANMGHSKKYGAKYGAVMRCFVMRYFEGHIFDFLVDEKFQKEGIHLYYKGIPSF